MKKKTHKLQDFIPAPFFFAPFCCTYQPQNKSKRPRKDPGSTALESVIIHRKTSSLPPSERKKLFFQKQHKNPDYSHKTLTLEVMSCGVMKLKLKRLVTILIALAKNGEVCLHHSNRSEIRG
ncbi:hypothetical protein XENOCAPTIV_020242 [Xenoophorus captivus]|uniref:Uncharacterized protein n=1 Tax=Xenoophorus captivus TaxID=1517983 RepID=A0ABV0Q3U7_9TELE